MLEVVEDEELVVAGEILPDNLTQLASCELSQAKGGGHGGQHLIRITQRGKVDEDRAVGVAGRYPLRYGERKARLSCPARPREREEADGGPGEQFCHRR